MASPSLDNTLGAVFLGYSLSSILYGATVVQTFSYATSQRRRSDGFGLKTFVFTLFFFDTVHTILSMIGMYRVYVIGIFGMATNQTALQDTYVSGCEMLEEAGAFGLLMMVLAQIYFARRVWTMGSIARFPRYLRVLVPIGITVFAIFACGVNSVITVTALQHRKESDLFKGSTIEPIFTLLWKLSFSTSIVCDVIIAAAMIAMLRQARKGHPNNGLLHIFTLFTINTGLVTILLTITALVQFLVLPTAIFYVGLELLIPKSYCISVLAALNARDYLREKLKGSESTESTIESLPVFKTVTTHHHPRKSIAEQSESLESPIQIDQIESPHQFEPPIIEWQPPTRTPSPIVFAERPLRHQV